MKETNCNLQSYPQLLALRLATLATNGIPVAKPVPVADLAEEPYMYLVERMQGLGLAWKDKPVKLLNLNVTPELKQTGKRPVAIKKQDTPQ